MKRKNRCKLAPHSYDKQHKLAATMRVAAGYIEVLNGIAGQLSGTGARGSAAGI